MQFTSLDFKGDILNNNKYGLIHSDNDGLK